MACDFKPMDRPKCDVWQKQLQSNLETELRSNPKAAQAKLETQMMQLSNDDDRVTCIDPHTSFLKTPVDEFCAVATKATAEGKIPDKRISTEVDAFCKNLSFTKLMKLFSKPGM